MGKIVLIEAHPLLRLGLWQILNKLGGVWEIVEMDFSEVAAADPGAIGVDLLIYGVPIDADSEWVPLTDIQRTLKPKRVLLLTDVLPLPPSVHGLPGVPVYGCVMKTVSVEILEAAIRLVMAGGQCFPGKQVQQTVPMACSLPGPSMALHTSEMSMGNGANGVNGANGTNGISTTVMAEGAQLLQLTPRQYEVLVLLARGHPIKTISRMLNISVATAKTHACTLYQRLHVRNKGEAVYAALQRGATLEWHDTEREPPRASSSSSSSSSFVRK